MGYPAGLRATQRMIDKALAASVPRSEPALLRQAMLYSLLAGGKRMRPQLMLAAAQALGARPQTVLKAACALECLHTYSLIHDDLPAMDDDDLRRGLPTCHKKFGEATAILAGDGLLTLSFELMAQSSKDASRAREACHVLAVAAGARGMVGGQGLDLQAEGRRSSPRALRRIHAGKTGALITASLECGAILAGADAKKRTALRRFGDHIGLAFQVADDILNVEGDQAKLGKKTGSDLAKAKTTYPGVFGLEKSKKIAKKELENALRCLKPFGKKAEPLARLARFVVERDH